jgi:hypothetical protein
LILSKNTRGKEPWFDHLHKGSVVFIIFMDVIKVESGLKMGAIISICGPDNGFRTETKAKTPEVLCYTGRSPLMSSENKNSLSKVHASAPRDLDTIWLISWKTHIKNILFQSISEVKIQPHIDKPPRTSRSIYWDYA